MIAATSRGPETANLVRRISPEAWLCLALTAIVVVGICVLLWPQWLRNPDLSHGWFMPIVFLVLLHEGRTHGPQRFFPQTRLVSLAQTGALLLGLLGLVAGGLYAAALDWSHAMVGFTFAMAVVLLLLGVLLSLSAEPVRLVPFNWSTLLAVGLWLLTAPIPPGTYSRLTLGLQLWVSENVLSVLHLLGIPARAHGNIIELANASVGIEEACSGVRSLISCVFAGFFFSGCLVRRGWTRTLLIGLSVPLAIGMNFLRSLGLTLLANAGVDISGAWHDLTGFAVLGATALILVGLALLLERGEKALPSRPVNTAVSSESVPSSAAPLRLTAAALGVSVAVAVFFATHTKLARVSEKASPPNLATALPESMDGWRVITAHDLQRFTDELQTDVFVQRTYLRELPDGPHQLTVYLAYWAPGQASASLVATHTPDACWPGAGWEPVPIMPLRARLASSGRTLPEGEHRLFRNRGMPQHVWFWHLYDRQPIEYIDPLSPKNLLEIAARYGFRPPGEQMFVRISTNRPWNDVAHEPLVAEIFERLQAFGL